MVERESLMEGAFRESIIFFASTNYKPWGRHCILQSSTDSCFVFSKLISVVRHSKIWNPETSCWRPVLYQLKHWKWDTLCGIKWNYSFCLIFIMILITERPQLFLLTSIIFMSSGNHNVWPYMHIYISTNSYSCKHVSNWSKYSSPSS